MTRSLYVAFAVATATCAVVSAWAVTEYKDTWFYAPMVINVICSWIWVQLARESWRK